MEWMRLMMRCTATTALPRLFVIQPLNQPSKPSRVLFAEQGLQTARGNLCQLAHSGNVQLLLHCVAKFAAQ